jgi:hypothetical protein
MRPQLRFDTATGKLDRLTSETHEDGKTECRCPKSALRTLPWLRALACAGSVLKGPALVGPDPASLWANAASSRWADSVFKGEADGVDVRRSDYRWAPDPVQRVLLAAAVAQVVLMAGRV